MKELFFENVECAVYKTFKNLNWFIKQKGDKPNPKLRQFLLENIEKFM